MNFTIDARGMGPAWVVDAQGYLVSRVYLTPEQYQARSDLVLIPAPAPDLAHRVRFIEGAWLQEPLPAPVPEQATWEQVRDWRDRHEIAPITTSFGIFDCDPRSEARMAGSIEEFDSLPTLDADGKLTWKLADNSYLPVTKSALQQVYDEMKTNRAQRGAILHVKAEQFSLMDPRSTVAELADLAFWLT